MTLDNGALIAAERNDRTFWIEWKRALQADTDFRLPTVVVSQAWRGDSHPLMSKVIAACDKVDIDLARAKAAGALLAETRRRDPVDALVATIAARHGDEIWGSDPEDLRRLMEVATDGRGAIIRRF